MVISVLVDDGVPEKVQTGGVPPVAGKTCSVRVVPLRVRTRRSGTGVTAEPAFEMNVIEVAVLPGAIGATRGATQPERRPSITRVMTGRARWSATTR